MSGYNECHVIMNTLGETDLVLYFINGSAYSECPVIMNKSLLLEGVHYIRTSLYHTYYTFGEVLKLA